MENYEDIKSKIRAGFVLSFEEENELEKIVGDGFDELLSNEKIKILLNGAQVKGYNIKYSPKEKGIKIEVTKIQYPGNKIKRMLNKPSLPRGEIPSSRVGAYSHFTINFYDPNNNHPLIKKFKENYAVKRINGVI